MAKSGPTATQTKAMERDLRKAKSGKPDLAWLHRLVLKTGYVDAACSDSDVVLVTITQLAKRLAHTRRTLERWRREGMPVVREGAGRKPALYDPFDVLKWLDAKREAERETEEASLLAGGGTSKWLEECRKEKAIQLKRLNEIDSGRLVPADEIARELAIVGEVFRAEAEGISRLHGAEVGEAITQMIDRAEQAWNKLTTAEKP